MGSSNDSDFARQTIDQLCDYGAHHRPHRIWSLGRYPSCCASGRTDQPESIPDNWIGLIKNPLVLSISSGLLWAAFEIPVPELLNRFMTILGGASTPGALFAIGASMAFAARGQITIPLYLSANKLIMHPLLVGIASLLVFQIDPFASAVMIACAAMPVAGNVYMIATHYGLPGERISIAILISTTVSIVSISLIISVTQFYT